MEKDLEFGFINDVLNVWDNISYMPFNIWRLPQLLRFYKTKFSQSLRCPQNTMSQNTHSKISTNKKIPCPKNLMPKNSMSNKKILCKKSHVQHQQTKNPTKIPCPTKNPMPKIKFFPCPTKNSMSNQKKKNSPCPTKIPWPKKFYAKNPMSNIKIHTTTKFFHTHTHKNFHTHEIRLAHSNKISTLIKSEFVQSILHIKFSWFQYP